MSGYKLKSTFCTNYHWNEIWDQKFTSNLLFSTVVFTLTQQVEKKKTFQLDSVLCFVYGKERKGPTRAESEVL